MPLGAVDDWQRANMVTAAEILATLREHLTLTPLAGRGSAPAQEWSVAASDCHPSGRVGVIPSVTAPFCAACDRTRVTADGQLRSCLFANSETDLRTPLRTGATDAELTQLWRGSHLAKQANHGIDTPGFRSPARGMSAIGG
jgi:GTP 3',8-cyclase